MEPVDLQSLWICAALWIRGAQAPRSPGSMEHRLHRARLHGAQTPQSPGSTEHRLHGAQAPRSPGSTEHRLHEAQAHRAQAPRSTGSTEPRMAAYHINGNTIHSMILANEHRSLGPIFLYMKPLPTMTINVTIATYLHNYYLVQHAMPVTNLKSHFIFKMLPTWAVVFEDL